jgi:RNA polymerase sigma factor (sigma-70 family)
MRADRELRGPIGKEQEMAPLPTDGSVIAASLVEPERFAVIFDRHFATVFRFAQRRVGRDQAAEVAAEALARAFAKRGSFRREAVDALPWLLGIASKLILHERRRFVRYLAAVERASADVHTLDRDGDLGSVDRRLDAPADWARMRAALMTLSDTDRELLLLVTWDELSYEDAAAVLDLPIGTVRSKLHRAKARLRELLEPSGRTRGDRPIPAPKEAT